MNITQDLQTLIDEWDEALDIHKTPPPLIKLPNDPVACACASYRTWKENPARRWADLETVVVWQDDIEEAERLKKYYRESMVMEALKSSTGINRSKFRQKLAKLVVNELEITKEEIGLLMRLPYFYAEDQALDHVKAVTDDRLVNNQTRRSLSECTLKPLQKILISRRAGDFYNYWFTDTDNTPYNFVIKADNPLIKLFDGLYTRPELRINADLYPKTMRGYRNHSYYQLGSMELA